MKTPLATQQLRHFQLHRELKDVPKQPLERPDLLSRRADSYLRLTRHEDNDGRDHDPLPHRILRWSGGMATSARFEADHLERIDATHDRSYVHHIHRTLESLDFFYALSCRDGHLLVECSHLDYLRPDLSFHQRLSSESQVRPADALVGRAAQDFGHGFAFG